MACRDRSLFIVEDLAQAPKVRLDLDDKLVALVEHLFGVAEKADARRGASQDHSPLGQRCALGQVGDDLGHREDEVTSQGRYGWTKLAWLAAGARS